MVITTIIIILCKCEYGYGYGCIWHIAQGKYRRKKIRDI